MRRTAIAALTALLLLTACSGGNGGGSDLPAVEGELGAAPTVTFSGGTPPAELESVVLTEGDGPTVEAGDLLVAHYQGQIWDGDVFDSSYERGAPAGFPIGVGAVIPGWDAGLVGKQVGSRVLLSIPPEQGYGEAGQPAAGIGGEDTLVFVVDLIGSYGSDAGGDPEAEPTGAEEVLGLQVDGALGAEGSVTVPEGVEEPTEMRVDVVATGTGPAVGQGTVVVHYSITQWDGTAVGSTWQEGGPQAAIAGGTGGVYDELLGIPVGSRVLFQMPATEQAPAAAVVLDIVDQPSI